MHVAGDLYSCLLLGVHFIVTVFGPHFGPHFCKVPGEVLAGMLSFIWSRFNLGHYLASSSYTTSSSLTFAVHGICRCGPHVLCCCGPWHPALVPVIALHGFIVVGLLTFTCCLHEARAGAGQGFLYGLSWLLSTKKHTVILGRSLTRTSLRSHADLLPACLACHGGK